MKVGLKWKIAFAIITLIAIAGLFWKPVIDVPGTGEFLGEENIVGSDVAWILAAAGLVLLMTPGLSFFYGGMVGKKKCYFHNVTKFYCFRSNIYSLGCCWLFTFIWRFNRFHYKWRTLWFNRKSIDLSVFLIT